MASETKVLALESETIQDQIDRKMLAWVNLFPEIPEDVYKGMIIYEQLPADKKAMALSTIQTAYITKRFILGGYQGEYQFTLLYRIKPGDSTNKRLAADELLNRFGDWALTADLPDLGEGIRAIKVEPTTRSSMLAVYENGDEDHQILMKLTYERV